MAPIHKEQSYSLYSSSSAATPFSCSCRRGLRDEFEWFLPITRRGHFFQDSFFENARSHFETAIQDILGKWDSANMLGDAFHDKTTSNFSRYRQLRSRDMKEENQAVTVSSDSSSHKIVLDVHDFSEGDIKVKVIGEKEVLVEGQIENRKEKSGGNALQKFSRRFLLPEDCDVEAITSVMSAEGILTILTPMKKANHSQESTRIILHKEASSSKSSQKSKFESNSSQKNSSEASKCAEEEERSDSEKYCENCYKKLQSAAANKQPRETLHDKINIPVQNDTTLKQTSNTSQISVQANGASETMGKSTVRKCQAETMGKLKVQNCQAETMERSNVRNCQAESASHQYKVSEHETDLSSENHGASRNVPISVNFSTLPVIKRGDFFNDSIFESSRGDFLHAVRDVLSKWGERSSLMDDLTTYRRLRNRDLREENQAVKINEDENSHKLVLDVQDFLNGGEVTVKAINSREIAVEGILEKQEGSAKSVKRFFRRFTVPGDVQLESVSSILSADGILTITAPKKPPTIEIREVTSPTRTDIGQVLSTKRETKESTVNCENEATTTEVQGLQRKEDISKAASSKCRNSTEAHLSHAEQRSTNEHIIPVLVEGSPNAAETELASQVANDSSCSQDESMKKTSMSSSSSSLQSSSVGMCNSSTQQNRRESSITQKNAANQENELGSNLTSSPGYYLPITRRGSFLSDSFFEDARHSFQEAVKDVLLKFNEKSYPDDFTAYRGLRQRNLTSENQAYSLHEDESCHKVVVDAGDFIDGDVSVSVVGKKELVIEGKRENKKDASSSSSLSFCRRFLLPDNVEAHTITAAISSDGILTVESPKKNGSSAQDSVKKMSSEAHAKQESHIDGGHLWEEQLVKESSEQSQGYSSRCISKSYRSHQEQAITNTF